MVAEIAEFARLMRRYAYAYTCCHDFSVARQIMVPDYSLRMGPHRLSGRDGAYRAAAQHQFDEFPGLCLTVHRVVCNGRRLAMSFTEHGHSRRRGGAAAWSGLALYQWDGRRLTECRVEQDYWSRRRQLDGVVHPVQPPPATLWTVPALPVDPEAESAVRGWLGSWSGRSTKAVLDELGGDAVLDDEACAPAERAEVEVAEVEVADLFSAGQTVAFHASVRGRYLGGLAGIPPSPTGVVGYLAGLAECSRGRVVGLRAVTDRLGVARTVTERQLPNSRLV